MHPATTWLDRAVPPSASFCDPVHLLPCLAPRGSRYCAGMTRLRPRHCRRTFRTCPRERFQPPMPCPMPAIGAKGGRASSDGPSSMPWLLSSWPPCSICPSGKAGSVAARPSHAGANIAAGQIRLERLAQEGGRRWNFRCRRDDRPSAVLDAHAHHHELPIRTCVSDLGDGD
jgi:hypothetical protein